MCGRYALYGHVLGVAIAGWFALTALPARALFDAPYITPAAPVADELVSVNIRGGICDQIFDYPGYPQLTRDGNAVRIVFYSAHSDDPLNCYFGVDTTTADIGAYSAGTYTLQVDRTYDFFGDLVIESLGTVPFVVTGTTGVRELPAIDLGGACVLAVGLIALAIHGVCRAARGRT